MDGLVGGDAVIAGKKKTARVVTCFVLGSFTMLSVSCAETGQDRATVPLYLVGTEISEPVLAMGDVPVSIDRADLAFGPLYLCAGNTAGELCDTARLEWLQTAVIDTKSATPMAVGELTGVTGSARSWMYDLGISSQLSRNEPYVLEAAEDLGGASFVFEGRAVIEGVEIPVSASVPIQQNDTTELGVPVIRKGTDVDFSHEVTGEEERLTLRFDPAAWISRLDLRPFLEDESCETSDRAVVCQGQTELSCDASGGLVESRECGEIDQVCLRGLGCVADLHIEEGSEPYQSLAIALSTTGRPDFEWDD